MNVSDGQIIRRQAGGKPVAIRYFVAPPTAQDIDTALPVKFMPEFGAVAYNLKIERGPCTLTSGRVEPPQIREGMTVRHIVDVEHGGRLIEQWGFESDHVDGRGILEFVIDEMPGFDAARQKELSEPRPEPFYKTRTDEILDPWENSRQVMLRLLAREYPLLAKTLSRKDNNTSAAQSFAVDCVRRTGCAPGAVNLNDPKFVAELAEAFLENQRRNVRKSRVDPVDFYLANPRNWAVLHPLPFDEIAQRVTATGIPMTATAVRKRLSRLGLVSSRKSGPAIRGSRIRDRK